MAGCITLAVILAGPAAVAQFTGFPEEFLDSVREEYGRRAQRTIERWGELVAGHRTSSEREKLEAVNLFFNRSIRFVNDIDHWRRREYWATPMETMVSGGGDCEDFSIAKYFTLRELGVADDKLRLTYVRVARYDAPHMVVAYYETRNAEPLILDNLVRRIWPASERRDLTPVYSFNGLSLWRARTFGEGREVGSADAVRPWLGVLRRMDREGFPYRQ